MNKKRKIEPVIRKVTFAQAEEEDMIYWMNLSATKRFEELLSLKQMIWTKKDKPYPEIIEKIAEKKLKSQTDSDDF
jgi:hypothetical protein